MRNTLLSAAIAALTLAGAATGAAAATQSAFERVNNDGVFTLSTAQQAYFGTTATRLGFLRVRSKSGGSIAAGTTFDEIDVRARCQAGCSTISAILNGNNGSLSYEGGFLSMLGNTTVSRAGGELYRSVAFLFGGTSNVVFRGSVTGSATFNPASPDGDLDFAVPLPVPLPAAGWLLLAGLGGLIAARRRKAARADA